MDEKQKVKYQGSDDSFVYTRSLKYSNLFSSSEKNGKNHLEPYGGNPKNKKCIKENKLKSTNKEMHKQNIDVLDELEQNSAKRDIKYSKNQNREPTNHKSICFDRSSKYTSNGNKYTETNEELFSDDFIEVENDINEAVDVRNRHLVLTTMEYLWIVLNKFYYFSRKVIFVFIAIYILVKYVNPDVSTNETFKLSNLCTLNHVRITEISKLYKFGFMRKQVTNVENMMIDNNLCTSLENRNQPYFVIEMDKAYYVAKIAFYHPMQGNPKSPLNKFVVVYESGGKKIKKLFKYESRGGYQEFEIDAVVDGLKIKIMSNHGESYISIYKMYIFGY